MDFMSNEITFGNFDDLSQDHEVYKILYGSRQADSSRVEFPWDSKEGSGLAEASGSSLAMCGQPIEEQYYQPQDQVAMQQYQNRYPDDSSNYNDPSSENYYDSNINNNSSLKPERRNKKRRPPGYYEKLQEEIEMEKTQRMSTEPYTNDRMAMNSNYYSSQGENDTETNYMANDHANYHQSCANEQNQYESNFNSNVCVDSVTEEISHVTISNSENFSHPHEMHTTSHVTHDHYSYHPPPNHPQFAEQSSQVPFHSSQTVDFHTEESNRSHVDSHSNKTVIASHSETIPNSIIDTSVPMVTEKTNSGASEIVEDTKQIDSEQSNIVEEPETENENLVDFASYPPLQPATSNIPIGASVKQESPEKTISDAKSPDDSSKRSNEAGSGQPQSVWGKPKAWSNLFKGDERSSNASVIYTNNENYADTGFSIMDEENAAKEKQIRDMPPVPAIHDSAADILGDFFSQYKIVHTQVGLQPRGLMNRGNWCYINATLQALISCPPFYNLLKKIPTFRPLTRGPSSTPILDSLIQFVGEFTPCARIERVKGKRPEIPSGPMFEPTYVYKMLQVLQDTATFKLGRQEDAEEFLSCILDGMHEEMLACMRVNKGESSERDYEANGVIDNSDNEGDPDSWEQVGPKKKSVLTRKNDFASSPLADIFVGYVRSAVYKTTSKDSATVEPFFTLKLEIQSEKVNTVREALERMVSKESVSGFTCSKTNSEMEITKKLTLEQLPPVLILHLKCFVYDKNGGSQKVIKDITFTVDLEITRDLLSPNVKNRYTNSQRFYKLFAVVYHHGKKATGGHYTTAVFHPAINGWINYDDSNVRVVPVTNVLQFSALRVPYLLYYRRVDLH